MGCVFCRIVARAAPANIRYEDDETIVIDNRLRLAPVMLLVMPKRHMSQSEMWSNGLISRIGQVAVKMGEQYCPQGFRLLSNFGAHALQTQEHAHLHVVGGMPLGLYV